MPSPSKFSCSEWFQDHKKKVLGHGRHFNSARRSFPPLPEYQTRYMQMLLQLDRIPLIYNIIASLATWILLAGYIVLPGTFTSLRTLGKYKFDSGGSAIEGNVQNAIRNIPLLSAAFIFFAIGGACLIYLWCIWGENVIWLMSRIIV